MINDMQLVISYLHWSSGSVSQKQYHIVKMAKVKVADSSSVRARIYSIKCFERAYMGSHTNPRLGTLLLSCLWRS